MSENINLNNLADSFVGTDTHAIRDDVRRLGSVKAAAKYSSEIAVGQPDWELLASAKGRKALEAAIRRVLEN